MCAWSFLSRCKLRESPIVKTSLSTIMAYKYRAVVALSDIRLKQRLPRRYSIGGGFTDAADFSYGSLMMMMQS